MTALVVGVGNAWRGDDGAGLEVARRLSDAGVRARAVDPSRLLDAWAGESEVILVDAARSGAQPGTIHRLDALAQPLPAWLSSRSTHDLGVAQAIELARCLGRLPARLEVHAIEGARFCSGEGLSPEVARAVDELVIELGACGPTRIFVR